jgi:hypothetical protein
VTGLLLVVVATTVGVWITCKIGSFIERSKHRNW